MPFIFNYGIIVAFLIYLFFFSFSIHKPINNALVDALNQQNLLSRLVLKQVINHEFNIDIININQTPSWVESPNLSNLIRIDTYIKIRSVMIKVHITKQTCYLNS